MNFTEKELKQIEDLKTRASGHCQNVYLKTEEEQFDLYSYKEPDLYFNICMDAGIKPLEELL